MIRSIIIIALLCFSVISLSSCAGASRKDGMSKGDALLEPQVSMKFSDIPAPMGFKFMSEGSYTFESSGVRVGVLRYQGKADIEQVVNFYKDQMPLYNWNMLNAIEYGERLLNFDREQESCIISLSPKGRNITIVVSVGPKSTLKPKKSEKPVK